MSFISTIYTGTSVFKAVVDFDRETTHPDSPLRLETSLTDERVPKGLILACNNKGSVAVHSGRPEALGSGDKTTAEVSAKFLRVKGVWAVARSRKGTEVVWFSNWSYLPCTSKAHCNHIIDLLKGGKVPLNLNPIIV